jgi:cobalt/nickel transport system permease protein
MHIPDGFLDAKTALATGALSLTGLAVALRHARLTLPPRKVPLLGLSAAFIFAAQLINFPIGAGASGHLIGGTLAAALLGPSAAVIVLTAVLIVQCLMLADGGITALGANVFNMAIVGGTLGWMAFAGLRKVLACVPRLSPTGQTLVAAAGAAWLSTVLSAVACSGELAASGTVSWRLAFPTITGIHAVIGIAEAFITTLALSAILAARPELLLQKAATPADRTLRPFVAYGVLVVLGMALFVAPFASTLPDGLEHSAERLGFLDRATAAFQALPANTLTGILGTVAAMGVALLLARVLLLRRSRQS